MNLETVSVQQASRDEDNLVDSLKKEVADLRKAKTLLEKHKKLNEQEFNNRKTITIDQFCARNNLNKPLYYALVKDGLVPKAVKLVDNEGKPVMRRSFIRIEDEAKWQADPNRWKHYDYDMGHTKVDENGNPRNPLKHKA